MVCCLFHNFDPKSWQLSQLVYWSIEQLLLLNQLIDQYCPLIYNQNQEPKPCGACALCFIKLYERVLQLILIDCSIVTSWLINQDQTFETRYVLCVFVIIS